MQSNRGVLSEAIARSKQEYYRYEPYFKRGTNIPSWQWEFLRAIDSHDGRIAVGANRIGKSEQGAYECNLAVMNEHPAKKFADSGIGWIVGLDFNMIQSVDLPMFEKFMPKAIMSSPSKFYAKDMMWNIITPKGEWQVWFKSSEAGREKFQSAKVNWIWFDEEPKKINIFNECMMRLIDLSGIWWMTATPLLGTKWLKDMCNQPYNFSCTGGMADNPYLPLEKVEKEAAKLSEEERDVRIYGRYVLFGGKPVFKMKILNDMIKQLEDETPAETGILVAA